MRLARVDDGGVQQIGAPSRDTGEGPLREPPAKLPRPPREPDPQRLAKLTLFKNLTMGIGLGLVAFASVAILVGYLLAGARPGWWTAVDTQAPETVETAKRLHLAMTNLLNQRRDAADGLEQAEAFRSAPWTVSLPADDANAWLNIEMPRWLRSSPTTPSAWLDIIDQVRVDFDGTSIRAGVEVNTEEGHRRLWVTVDPEIDPNGSLWMRARTVHLGRLSLPASWILDRAEADLEQALKVPDAIPGELRDLPEARALISAFRGEQPVAIDPVIRLFDGRRVRLLELAPRDGRLLITCQTEHRAQARR